VWCDWQVTLCDPHLSALEVRFSRRCTIQIDVYLYLYIDSVQTEWYFWLLNDIVRLEGPPGALGSHGWNSVQVNVLESHNLTLTEAVNMAHSRRLLAAVSGLVVQARNDDDDDYEWCCPPYWLLPDYRHTSKYRNTSNETIIRAICDIQMQSRGAIMALKHRTHRKHGVTLIEALLIISHIYFTLAVMP